MYATAQTPTVNPILIGKKVNIDSPRDTYSFLNRLVNDKSFYDEFQNQPLKIFKEYNFDTSKITIPADFILPSQDVLRDRLSYINNYEDFVSPSQIQSLPVLPVIFVFIPVFAS